MSLVLVIVLVVVVLCVGTAAIQTRSHRRRQLHERGPLDGVAFMDSRRSRGK